MGKKKNFNGKDERLKCKKKMFYTYLKLHKFIYLLFILIRAFVAVSFLEKTEMYKKDQRKSSTSRVLFKLKARLIYEKFRGKIIFSNSIFNNLFNFLRVAKLRASLSQILFNKFQTPI